MASSLISFESSAFLPVGTPKTLVYAAAYDNEEAFHRRIVDACQAIPHYRGIFKRMCRSTMRRVLNLMEDILSTHYECTLSATICNLNISGHMLM
jgi:hypothetical protein